MLDEVTLPNTVLDCIGKKFAYHIELVVARENLDRLFQAGLRVLLLNDLRVVLDDVGDAARRQKALPEVIRLQSFRVGRIARAIVPALIERQEQRPFTLELRQ